MKNPFKKEQIKSLRKFTYSKTGVNLSFELNINDKGQMYAFKELLEKAIIDVGEAIEKIEPKKLFVKGGSHFGGGASGTGGDFGDVPIERETP